MSWVVYVLQSETLGATYVGIALDVDRRLRQHNGALRGGARTTRRGRPWRVGASFGPYPTRGIAQRIEREIRRLRGPKRLSWQPSPIDSLLAGSSATS